MIFIHITESEKKVANKFVTGEIMPIKSLTSNVVHTIGRKVFFSNHSAWLCACLIKRLHKMFSGSDIKISLLNEEKKIAFYCKVNNLFFRNYVEFINSKGFEVVYNSNGFFTLNYEAVKGVLNILMQENKTHLK